MRAKRFKIDYFYIFLFILSSLFFSNFNITLAQSEPKYNITQSVKYQIEINYTLNDLNGVPNEYYFKIPRLDNRMPDSLNWLNTSPYQETELLYHKIINETALTSAVEIDKFNNTYDLFNASLSSGQSIALSQTYDVILNEVVFRDIDDYEIGNYNMNDEIFDLYCNQTEIYFDIEDSNLIFASNNLTGISPPDNPIEKAKKIGNWVGSHLEYDETLTEEKGALWAYINERGDCSEFSDLMITLLRIQKIPARKVSGILLSNQPGIKPHVGQDWIFSTNPIGEKQRFLRHAWVEYYVDNIGWIPVDPTWHKITNNFFNRIDYQRFTFTVGAWFSVPNQPDVSEFPILYVNSTYNSTYNSEYLFRIEVLEAHLINPDDFPYIITIIPISVLFLIFVIYRLANAPREEVVTHKKKYIGYNNPPSEKLNQQSTFQLDKPTPQFTSQLKSPQIPSYDYPTESIQQTNQYYSNNYQIPQSESFLQQTRQFIPPPQPDHNSQNEIITLRNQANNLNLILLDKDNEIRKLRGQAGSLQAQIQNYEMRKNQINQETGRLISEIQYIEQNNINLQQKLAPLWSQVQSLKQELSIKDTKIKKLKEPKAVMSSSLGKRFSNQDLSLNKDTSYIFTSNPTEIKRKTCPNCGATGQKIKDIIDKKTIITYTPDITYAKKNYCKQCGCEF